MTKKSIAILTVMFASMIIAAAALAQSLPISFQGEVPKDSNKTTSLGKYVTAAEAYRMYAANPDKIFILDVRTPEEYALLGHAPQAFNIPSKLWTGKFDPAKKDYGLVNNPDFEAVVKEKFRPEDTIMVMCRSGVRGAEAVNRMAKIGFTNVYNVTDGFEGEKITEEDSYYKGKRMKNGWRNSGLPWTTDLDPKLIYLPTSK